jgi:hypothetical protein
VTVVDGVATSLSFGSGVDVKGFGDDTVFPPCQTRDVTGWEEKKRA